MHARYDMTIIILLEKRRDYKDKNIHSVVILYRIYIYYTTLYRYYDELRLHIMYYDYMKLFLSCRLLLT